MKIVLNKSRTENAILEELKMNDDKLSLDQTVNHFIFGDNFDVMTKLINNSWKNSVDLIYIDPPYNTDQIFTVEEGRTSTISRAKNGTIAYDDRMDLDNYLEFIRERLILMRELLSSHGSIYLHIDFKVGHYVKIIMDEVFGVDNFKNHITRIKSNPKNFKRSAFGNQTDMILFYAKDARKNIFNDIKIQCSEDDLINKFPKTDEGGRRYNTVPVHAPGETLDGDSGREWKGLKPPPGRHWRTSRSKLSELDNDGLIEWSSTGNPRIKKYADEHEGMKVQDFWEFKDPQKPKYPTQKNEKMLKMIIEQSSNIGSIVLDCFAGSGSTLKAADELNRKFVGIDKSPQSLKVIKKELSQSNFVITNLMETDHIDLSDQAASNNLNSLRPQTKPITRKGVIMTRKRKSESGVLPYRRLPCFY
jgi:adenine-specific DNA-methyltransferase